MNKSNYFRTLMDSMGSPGVKVSSDGKALIFNGEMADQVNANLSYRKSKSTGAAWDFTTDNYKIEHLDAIPKYKKITPKSISCDQNYGHSLLESITERYNSSANSLQSGSINFDSTLTARSKLSNSIIDEFKPTTTLPLSSNIPHYDSFTQWGDAKEKAFENFNREQSELYQVSSNSIMSSSLLNQLPVRPGCDALGFGSESSEDYPQADYSNSKYLWQTIDTTPGQDVSETPFIRDTIVSRSTTSLCVTIEKSTFFAGTYC